MVGGHKDPAGGSLEAISLYDVAGESFKYAVTDVVTQRLHKIDLGAGGLIGMPEPITNPQTRSQYVMRSLFQEAVFSRAANWKELLLPAPSPRR